MWNESFNAGIAKNHAGRQELAIQAIGSNITKIATSTQGMPAVKAAAEVARLGGWVAKDQAPGTTVNVLNVTAGRGLADMLRDIEENDVIDIE
jgi:hypothetical protein